MTHTNLFRAAYVVLVVGAAGTIGHSVVTWTREGWAPGTPLGELICELALPFSTTAAMKFSVCLMLYGVMRMVTGGAKATWFIRAGIGAALFNIIARDSYLFYKLGFEWVHFPNAAVDIAVIAMAILLVLLLRRLHPINAGARRDE